MADINDYGLKVGFPGVDVRTAPDYQMLYNSSWPTLSIAQSPQISEDYGAGTTQDSTNDIYYHGLGYVPLFIPYAMSSLLAGSVPSYLEIGARQNISADANFIYFSGGFHGLAVTLNTAVMIFPIDIETNYTAPVIQTASPGSIIIDRNYGIKATKEGKDFDSTDLRDFTVHSSTRGPLLHAISAGPAPEADKVGAGTFTYTHDLSYDPMFMAYVQFPGEPHKYVAANGYAGLSAVGSTITLYTSVDFNCSVVILKDPIDPADNVITANV